MFLWLWGGLGAFVFAVNSLIFSVWNTTDYRARLKAFAEFAAALITGGIFAQGFTATLQMVAERWFAADEVAVALTIGWASNYLWPKLLRRLARWVEAPGSMEPR